ncbi:hypothetical protein PoB_007663200 [Plakobranchus ocellatus]|uniref:Uncharacterized protein n=1 Tax=Plakobranchus ocellatus TaxID=259542 RepID=A0AAV4E0M0_9GAST|nr:hypothetical protein PoB_007663200 [Plakobranchus ocellatus]
MRTARRDAARRKLEGNGYLMHASTDCGKDTPLLLNEPPRKTPAFGKYRSVHGKKVQQWQHKSVLCAPPPGQIFAARGSCKAIEQGVYILHQQTVGYFLKMQSQV